MKLLLGTLAVAEDEESNRGVKVERSKTGREKRREMNGMDMQLKMVGN